jgi:cation diffusion facilitator family transporter
MSGPESLSRFAWLSIGAAILTIALKTGAYLVTGSVGLLSDAVESLVNLIGAVMALAMLTIAARPADEEHVYGHSKAEYFSSGVEGTLILIAALSIGWAAVWRLIEPRDLESVGIGLVVSAVAAAINLATAVVLLRAARRWNSVTLDASAHHLLTDVWTSAGVILGVGAVALTGWNVLDPLLALAVAANIVFTGLRIVNTSVHGLMDAALPPDEVEAVMTVLQPHVADGIEYHALRTRRAGVRRFVSLHILVPGDWTVERGHRLVDRIETEISDALPNSSVSTHLEPLHDPASWNDLGLDHPGHRSSEGPQEARSPGSSARSPGPPASARSASAWPRRSPKT